MTQTDQIFIVLYKAPEQDVQNAFLENGTFTVYMWPIGCTFFVQNATAEVQGNNKLLKSELSSPTQMDYTNLFAPTSPALKSRYDPLERSWEPLIHSIIESEIGTGGSADSSGGEQLPYQWLENIVYLNLNSSTLPGSSSSESPTVTERFEAIERALGGLTGLAYGMLVQSFRAQTLDASAGGNISLSGVGNNWRPTMALVDGQQIILRGRLKINGLQVVIGTLSVVMICLAVMFALAPNRTRHETPVEDVVRDGGVIDVISLANHSTLPSILADDMHGETRDYNGSPGSKDKRRMIAERTTIAYVFTALFPETLCIQSIFCTH